VKKIKCARSSVGRVFDRKKRCTRSIFSGDPTQIVGHISFMNIFRSDHTKGVALVLAAHIFLVGCSTFSGSSQSWLDFATLERASTPNSALACSPDICLEAGASRQMIKVAVDGATAGEALRRIEPSAQFRAEPSGDIRARYVAVTPLLRFKDDVDVLIRPAGPQHSILAVYSRSRIGISDFGTNAMRIDDLERQLRTDLFDGPQ